MVPVAGMYGLHQEMVADMYHQDMLEPCSGKSLVDRQCPLSGGPLKVFEQSDEMIEAMLKKVKHKGSVEVW